MIKLMIVDDHPLIRQGIVALLSDVPDMEVVAFASTGEEAILLAKKHRPDVILMDIRMPGIGGIGAIQKIVASHPDIKIIALTSCTEEHFATHVLKAGVQGYLTKGATVEKMVKAIHSVMAGKKFIAPQIAQKLALKSISKTAPPLLETLSIREFNIVTMLVEGLSHKEIAEKLFISVKTLNAYRYKIYEKLHVKSDVGLVLLAKQSGLTIL
jgi:two-component system invasion response regulator UvrY